MISSLPERLGLTFIVDAEDNMLAGLPQRLKPIHDRLVAIGGVADIEQAAPIKLDL
jgi:hypothetical protein